jgi:hypothetical protein
MTKLSKLLIAIGAITGVVLLGILLAGLSGKEPEPDAQESTSEPAPPADEETNPSSIFSNRMPREASQTLNNEEPMEASATAPIPMSGWHDKLEEILGSTSPDAEKAKQMLEMFPTLPADGQEEVARHLTNLLPDEDYGLMRSYLTNASLPEGVLDILLDDVLNRPNSVKMPALLEVARGARPPKAAEAKDFLKLFLEEDYGSDWDKWQAGIEQWLKANPD